MSGGQLFDYTYPNLEEADGRWEDEELNALYHDLFVGGEFSVRGYGGLAQSLDFYLSGDICEDGYREAADAFKAKWFLRTPKSRVEFYERRLQEACDRYKRELWASHGEACEIAGTGEGEPLPPIVDRDALLALADEMARDADSHEIAAQVTGREGDDAAVLYAATAEHLATCAARIRRACGEWE